MSDDTVRRLGASLIERYRVDREHGQGGMATVYLARSRRRPRLRARSGIIHRDIKPENVLLQNGHATDRGTGFAMLGNGERFFVWQSRAAVTLTMVRP